MTSVMNFEISLKRSSLFPLVSARGGGVGKFLIIEIDCKFCDVEQEIINE